MCTVWFQLTVIQGDIVKVSADAIVHPTNNSFYMGGEVGEFDTIRDCNSQWMIVGNWLVLEI